MSSASSNHDLIDELVEEFVARQQAGENPTIEHYCDKYPHLADTIRVMFPMAAMLEGVKLDASPVPVESERLDQIGDYQILGEIGRGGMGVVYEAHHQSLGRRVAIKLLPRRLSVDTRALARFHREARAVAQLHHSHIVPLFEVGNDDGRFFFAMQLISGSSLDKVISDAKSHSSGFSSRWSNATLEKSASENRSEESGVTLATESVASGSHPSGHQQPFRWIAGLGVQAADALAYAHQRGVIHRDVKPSNILLDEDGVVWLSDFGLAKVAGEDLTLESDIVGTLRYMAPERFSNQCDERADVYGLGLTLYELLALHPAFEASDRVSLIDKICRSEPVKLSVINRRVPRDLETIVMKAIDKEPRSRYRTAAALGHDLRRYMQDQPIRARRHTYVELFARWARRNKRLAAAMATVAVLLAVIAVGSTIASIKARSLQRVAEIRGAELRRTLYYSQMNHGATLVTDKIGFGELEELTSSWIPDADEADLRGWEWYFLRSFVSGQKHSIDGQTGEVWDVKWSPDQKLIASASLDGTVVIRDAISHRIYQRLQHPKRVWAATWNHDGSKLASSCDDGKLRIWDTNKWIELLTIQAHEAHIGTVNWSPDGRRLVSCSEDHTAKIWDATTGQQIGEPLMHEDLWVRGAVWSPDGKRIATGSSPGDTIYLWDAQAPTTTAPKKLIGHPSINNLCWSSDSSLLASSGVDGSVRIWDIEQEREKFRFNDHVGEPLRIAWSADDQWLASAGRDGTIRVWDTNRGKSAAVFSTHGVTAMCASWDRTGRWVSAGCGDGTIRVWDFDQRSTNQLQVYRSPIASIGWRDDDLLTIGGEQVVQRIDTNQGRADPLGRILVDLIDVVWNPVNLDFVAVARTEIVVRDANAEELFRQQTNEDSRPSACCWSPEGDKFAICDQPGLVEIIKTQGWNHREQIRLETLSDNLFSIRWSHDGNWLVGADYTGRVGVWNAKTGDLQSQVQVTKPFIDADILRYPSVRTAVECSPTGRQIAILPPGRDVLLWEPDLGNPRSNSPATDSAPLLTLTGHALPLTDADWSPEGDRIVTSSVDGTVRIWDSQSGRLAITLSAGKSVRSVAWHSGGKRIAAGTVDGRLSIWDATVGYERDDDDS